MPNDPESLKVFSKHGNTDDKLAFHRTNKFIFAGLPFCRVCNHRLNLTWDFHRVESAPLNHNCIISHSPFRHRKGRGAFKPSATNAESRGIATGGRGVGRKSLPHKKG